jgi:hypothetical protein
MKMKQVAFAKFQQDQEMRKAAVSQEANQIVGMMDPKTGALPSVVDVRKFSPEARRLAVQMAMQEQIQKAQLENVQSQSVKNLRENQTQMAPMTMEQIEQFKKRGYDVDAVPLGNGMFGVKQISPFGATGRAVLTPDEQEANRLGEGAYKFNESVLEAAIPNRTLERDLQQSISLLDSGVKTGWGQELILSGKKMLKTLGADMDVVELAKGEQLAGLLGNQVMSRIAQTKGAVSDKEMEYFRTISANYGNTPDGNKRILEFSLEAVKRHQKLASQINAWRKDKKSESEIRNLVNEYQDKYSIIPDAPAAPKPPEAPKLPAGWKIVTP